MPELLTKAGYNLNKGISASAIVLMVLAGFLSAQPSVKITGQVTGLGQPLPGVEVYDPSSGRGAITNEAGYYSLTVPATDSVVITYKHIGFSIFRFTFAVNRQDTKINRNVSLEPTTIQFSPIKILGNPAHKRDNPTNIGLRLLMAEDVEQIPAVGDPDIMRALQSEPGVATTSEISSQLYVRGGTADQNLILINGTPIFQPYHMFGVASAMNIDAVETLEFFPGGFSARYGDVLSSVIKVTSAPGNGRFSGGFSVNLLNAKAHLSGPIGDKLRYRIAGRRSYYDVLAPLVDETFPYRFSDGQVKLSTLTNRGNLITLNYFSSSDLYVSRDTLHRWIDEEDLPPDEAMVDSTYYMRHTDYDVSWGNRLFSLQHVWQASENLILETSIYQSVLRQSFYYRRLWEAGPKATLRVREAVNYFNATQLDIQNSDADNIFQERGFTLDMRWDLTSGSSLTGGIQYKQRQWIYDWAIVDFARLNEYATVFMDFPPDTLYQSKELNMASTYAELTRTFQKSGIRSGVRLTRDRQWYWEPRITAYYNFGSGIKLTANWGRFTQPMGSSVEYGFYSLAEILLLTPLRRETATHSILEIELNPNYGLNIHIQGYRKTFNHLVYVTRDNRIAGNGEAESRGLECSFKVNTDRRFSSTLKLGWSKDTRNIGEESFTPNFHQTLRVTGSIHIALNQRWTGSLLWSAATGRPANFQTMRAYVSPHGNAQEFDIELPKNYFWYPPFHRLDIQFRRRFSGKLGKGDILLQIINVYNRSNVLFYQNMTSEYDWENKRWEYSLNSQKGFPFFIITGLEWEF